MEFLPTVVVPAGFEVPEGFIPRRGPELPGAFEAALILPTGGLIGPRTQGFIGQGFCATMAGPASTAIRAVMPFVYFIRWVLCSKDSIGFGVFPVGRPANEV